MKKYTILFTLLLLTGFFLFSIGLKEMPAAPQEKILKIGSLLNLRLKDSLEVKRWMELFVKITNEKGGFVIGKDRYKLSYTAYDVGTDPATARAATEKAVLKDRVKFLISNFGDTVTQTITITEPNKVLTIGNGFEDEVVKPNVNYYIRGSGVFFARGMTFTIQKDYYDRGARTDVIVDPDSETGRIGNALWGATARLAGLKVVADIYYPADTVDFAPIATKILSYKPDIVELPFCTGDQIVNIIGALKDAGYKGLIYPGLIGPTLLKNLITKVGKEYMEGWETVFFDPRGFQKDPEMLALLDRYVKEYGEFNTEGIFWAGGWFFFKDAVEATKSVDVEVIRNYLMQSKKAVKDLIGFRQLFARPDLGNMRTVDVAPTDLVCIIKDGKMVPLKYVSVKTHYLASIAAYNMIDTYEKYWQKYGYPKFPEQPSLIDFSDLKKFKK